MDELFEPIPLYRDDLRERHAKAAQDLFDELVEKSGVDPDANAATIAGLRRLEAALANAQARLRRWSAFRTFLLVVGWLLAIVLVGILILLLVKAKVTPKVAQCQAAVDNLQARRDEKDLEAWAQMAPLNRLFDWQMPARLVHQVAPILDIDPFFTQGRLRDLQKTFGWDEALLGDPETRSVLFSLSGEINGNPFVIGRALRQDWEEKAYQGTKTIYWTERVPDGHGGSRTVTRTQTLVATIHKPAPAYHEGSFLLYGNDAAPDLIFSRSPSPLSAEDPASFSGKRHLKAAIRELEKFSRNLDDQYPFTMMANHEFEALFRTPHRNNEVQYRLLFTALAQKQMLDLLRDRDVGFGDDFSFDKHLKINHLRPAHLDAFDMDADPARFRDNDFREIRARFLQFNADYFHHLYFALAPILSIPLYQQLRTHETIYRSSADRASAFWEHEAFANHIGADAFAPHAARTPSILKTEARDAPDGTRDVAVTAHAFRGEDRVDSVTVWGRDGHPPSVDVPWIDYFPVSRSRSLLLQDADDLDAPDFELQKNAPSSDRWRNFVRLAPANAFFRRSVAAALRD